MDKLKAFLYTLIFRRTLFVRLDPRDNSVTFSKRLCRHIGIDKLKDKAKVFTFKEPISGRYGFQINAEDLPDYAAQADIQYNSKHRCVGYESLVPTVNRILYDYGMPHDKEAKLRVSIHVYAGQTFFFFRPQHANNI